MKLTEEQIRLLKLFFETILAEDANPIFERLINNPVEEHGIVGAVLATESHKDRELALSIVMGMSYVIAVITDPEGLQKEFEYLRKKEPTNETIRH